MQKSINLISKGLMFIIMFIGVVVFILIETGSTSEEGLPIPHHSAINAGLQTFYWVFGLCLLLITLFSLYQALNNPKKSINTAIGLVLAVIIYFICNAMASDEVPELWALRNKVMFTSENVKIADTALFLTYTFGIIVLLAILVGEAFTLFKKYFAK